jgi:hypothetical protein
MHEHTTLPLPRPQLLTDPPDFLHGSLSRTRYSAHASHPWSVYPLRLACNATNTFSAVSGKSVTRTPTASHTALAMAAATGEPHQGSSLLSCHSLSC